MQSCSDPATAVALYNIESNGDGGGGCPSEFRPNLTPKEVMQMGSFGGSYFRPIRSSVTNMSYKDVWKEFPSGNGDYAGIRFLFPCVRCRWNSQTWRLVFGHLSSDGCTLRSKERANRLCAKDVAPCTKSKAICSGRLMDKFHG